MTTKDKIARHELSLLELASEMNNVSKACRIMGYPKTRIPSLNPSSARQLSGILACTLSSTFATFTAYISKGGPLWRTPTTRA